jgi:hydroxymethylpyrimidine pyrophosphatase-like HAD family hydrolase
VTFPPLRTGVRAVSWIRSAIPGRGFAVWFFRAVACDLDGTLAVNDVVSADVLDAIGRARADRAVLLVTGRTRADLDRVFPGLVTHFDAVVTENGAVMRTAAGERQLHEPVDPLVDKALADRGVSTQRGQVLVALDGRDVAAASEVIAELGLDYQVVHNRGAAMILPPGVTKGSGLLSALDQLGLSAHNTVAVGDAENDFALLQSAEVGVAVPNAIPSLAEHADLVLEQPNGAGVSDLLSGPLLSGRQRLCPSRHRVPIGQFDDGMAVPIPGSQSSVLRSGESGSGKSYLAGLLAERWIEAGYSVLVVDPEGDHLGLADRPGVHVVDAATHLPAPSDLLAIARPNHASLVLDLSGLSIEDKLAYLRRLPAAIAAERTRWGFPHWVIYDEAHQREWLDDCSAIGGTVAEPGTCLVTWQPDCLPAEIRRTVDVNLTVSQVASDGVALRGVVELAGQPSRPFVVGKRVSTHVRHRHKYAARPLPSNRRFYFRDQDAGDPVAAATLEYHLSRQDFSRWVIGTLADHALGADLAGIERDLSAERAGALERARHQVVHVIESRYQVR